LDPIGSKLVLGTVWVLDTAWAWGVTLMLDTVFDQQVLDMVWDPDGWLALGTV
jgi:hypothetical protein